MVVSGRKNVVEPRDMVVSSTKIVRWTNRNGGWTAKIDDFRCKLMT
jgi:hypothetical protein